MDRLQQLGHGRLELTQREGSLRARIPADRQCLLFSKIIGSDLQSQGNTLRQSATRYTGTPRIPHLLLPVVEFVPRGISVSQICLCTDPNSLQ